MLIILPYGLGISRDCRWSANWREVINAGRKFMDSILSKSSTLVSVMGENNNYDQLRPEDHAQHPSGRVGKPEDIARMCLFLCQEENDFINGENITIDGGMTKKMIYLD